MCGVCVCVCMYRCIFVFQSRYVGYFDLVRNAYYGRMPRIKKLQLSKMNIVQVSGRVIVDSEVTH